MHVYMCVCVCCVYCVLQACLFSIFTTFNECLGKIQISINSDEMDFVCVHVYICRCVVFQFAQLLRKAQVKLKMAFVLKCSCVFTYVCLIYSYMWVCVCMCILYICGCVCFQFVHLQQVDLGQIEINIKWIMDIFWRLF